jgi:hypothetical protein
VAEASLVFESFDPGRALRASRSRQLVEMRSKRAKSTLFMTFLPKKEWPADKGMSAVKKNFAAKKSWRVVILERNLETVRVLKFAADLR